MADARVRIVLDDEAGGGNTWIVTVPVRRSYPARSSGVIHAAHEAVAIFTQSVLRDREQIAEKLIELEHRDA